MMKLLFAIFASALFLAPLAAPVRAQDEPAEPASPAPGDEPGEDPAPAPGDEGDPAPPAPPADVVPLPEPGEETPPGPPVSEPLSDTGVQSAGRGRYRISVVDRPLREVLEDLFLIAGRALPMDLEAAVPTVKLAMDDVTFWEAVDGLCVAGNAFLWGACVSDRPRVRARPPGETRFPPVAYAGPLRISVETLVRQQTYGPGSDPETSLELKLWVLPEPGVRILGGGGIGSPAGQATCRARDDTGHDFAECRSRWARSGDGYVLSLHLSPPGPEAKSISLLDLDVALALAGEFEEIEIENPAGRVGEEIVQGETRVLLESFEGTLLSFQVRDPAFASRAHPLQAGTAKPPLLRAFSPEGAEIAPESYRIEPLEDGVRYRLEMPDDAPAGFALRYRTLRSSENRTVSVTFENVSLNR